jgi:hypothetical protein
MRERLVAGSAGADAEVRRDRLLRAAERTEGGKK